VATRTLLLSGFEIENNHRQLTHTEIMCTAPLLTIRVPLTIAITEMDELPESSREQALRAARKAGRNLIVVSALGGTDQLGWKDFLDALGGAVPSWRALGPDYLRDLQTASGNRLPTGQKGEAWKLFEQLVGDGLEFCFARRVRRLGAAKRGSRLSDMIAQIPEGQILVVDAKATETSFDAAIHNLRPLIEYTNNQRIRQRGYNEVLAAIVVSKGFDQDASELASISRTFLAETRVPACFITAAVLGAIIDDLRKRPNLRSGLKWRSLLAGGPVEYEEFKSEVKALTTERY
jgi:hypothetical protein